ncbi:hypothetical protein ACFL21_00845 [Patescibacteria group bacterium]
MCEAIRFNQFDFTDEELESSGLKVSGDEVRVFFAAKDAVLPIVYHGKNLLVPWGCKTRVLKVPCTGFCRCESLELGKWQWLNPKSVMILVCCALVNGVWFQVRKGIDGVLIHDRQGQQRCYMLMKPATHYFKIMTGSQLMPSLIDQEI